MRTILIVDDEKDMRKKYKKLLVKKGFRILEAPNALEVANALMRAKSTIDLILLDINIKEVDGRDISEIVEEYAPNIPIIVTSVLPLQDQKLKIRRAVDYFNKSHKDELLLKKIRNVVGALEEKREEE